MATFTVNADYEDKDSDPLFLQPGDEVTTGVCDQTWPGWVWAENNHGKNGYVPEEILEPMGEGRFAVIEAFDPTVLTVKRGDVVESLKQIHRWYWCRNAAGKEGWVADYLLKAND